MLLVNIFLIQKSWAFQSLNITLSVHIIPSWSIEVSLVGGDHLLKFYSRRSLLDHLLHMRKWLLLWFQLPDLGE